jgi:hypothetical protein
VRVSTAYGFYEAVRDHLHLKVQAYMNKEKPVFEATKYLLFYVAADANDAVGKEHCFVLNRSEMWNCTSVPDTSKSYNFRAYPDSRLSVRYLPCPCLHCFNGQVEVCTNVDIVGEEVVHEISLVEHVIPELLFEPLDRNYINAVLEGFITQHNLRLPRRRTKPEYIKLIREQLPDYIIAEEVELP